jgi:N-acetylglucosaminyldiphosphoundecaprenol N-acetyl-beta-D-mannosaminyltransferase
MTHRRAAGWLGDPGATGTVGDRGAAGTVGDRAAAGMVEDRDALCSLHPAVARIARPDALRSAGSDASCSAGPDLAGATVRLLGLDFADLDAVGAAALLAARPADAPFGYVVTPNADHLVRLARDPGLAVIYLGALLRLLDSRVVAGVAAALRLPAPCVAPGSDVTALLLTQYLRLGEPVTIIGLRARWLPALVARFGLAPPAHCDPPMGFAADPDAFAATVAFVLAHPARFVFLAVGSPRQERLAAAIAATGQATGIGLCIGASLEFLAGATRRAPGWMKRGRLEWLFRLAGDPHRLARRYLVDSPAVLPMLLRARFSRPG